MPGQRGLYLQSEVECAYSRSVIICDYRGNKMYEVASLQEPQIVHRPHPHVHIRCCIRGGVYMWSRSPSHICLLTLASLNAYLLTCRLDDLASYSSIQHGTATHANMVVMAIPSLVSNLDDNGEGLANQNILVSADYHC